MLSWSRVPRTSGSGRATAIKVEDGRVDSQLPGLSMVINKCPPLGCTHQVPDRGVGSNSDAKRIQTEVDAPVFGSVPAKWPWCVVMPIHTRLLTYTHIYTYTHASTIYERAYIHIPGQCIYIFIYTYIHKHRYTHAYTRPPMARLPPVHPPGHRP